MKNKLVYVLTNSGRDDRFAAMAVLSLHTFQRRNHNADVFVVMDELTCFTPEKCCLSIWEDAKAVGVDISSEYAIMQCSRYFKTTLREHVKGDFLYIDGDTFVTDSLKEIDHTDADMAMVANLNCLYAVYEGARKRCRLVGREGFR